MTLINAWLMMKFTGTPVSFGKLLKLKQESANFGSIVNALIVFHIGNLNFNTDRIIDHWKDGGDPKNVVYGLLVASKNNISLTLSDAIAKDKKGIDIPKEITGIGKN